MDPPLTTVLEALLFAADEPLPLRRLAALLEERPSAEVRAAVEELRFRYDATGSALQVLEIAGGYRLLTRPETARWITRLLGGPGRPRLSQAALETLAIVAYRQPVTRLDLEEIRGVNAEGVLKTLVERDLITIVGRDEGLGRPLLYGTTETFLSYFGLNALADLPRADELEVFLAAREAEASRSPGPTETEAPADGPLRDAASDAEPRAQPAEAAEAGSARASPADGPHGGSGA